VAAQPSYPTTYAPPAPIASETMVKPVAVPTGPTEQSQIFFGYEISLPVASLNDFVSKPSYRGFEFGALWPVFKSLHVGAFFNHHTFYEEKGAQTYQLDSGALHANLYRYARFWTMGGAARYYLLQPDSVVRPYVGLRVGMTFVTAATLVADLSLYDTPIGFALAPEAGLIVRAVKVMDVSGSIRYEYSTASSGKLDNGSFMAFQLGLVFHKSR
jgi:outer membrane protein